MSFFFTRRFFPLFVTQFLGAFNDNLLKNAIVMLIIYKMTSNGGSNVQMLVTLASALFILPYFIFSATAGQFADKCDRAKLVRIIKITEIFIVKAAAIGFYLRDVNFLLLVIFAMGVHSTFFGPIKFALLPQHLKDEELLRGNAYIEMGTFLAILSGTVFGVILLMQDNFFMLVSKVLIVCAVVGYIASRYIPFSPGSDSELVIGKNIWKETWKIVAFAKENQRVYRCIIGISWFWVVGATYLTQIPTYISIFLRGEPTIVVLCLAVFSIGIGIGSLLCNKLLGGEIKSTYVPISMALMTVFGVDFYFASNHDILSSTALLGIGEFISEWNNIRILFDLLMIAISAGIYIVPLYAIMQHDSEVSQRARIIAANNILNAIFMVAAAIITLLMLSASFTIPQVFLLMALGNGLVGVYVWRLLGR